MKVQQFLAHHSITENPFGQEDAQVDHVFRQHCLEGTHHPAWDKIYGNPESPATAVVFGEKGAGKTALRLQIVEQISTHNKQSPDRKTFIIEYDDFNPFLDAFRERLHGRKKRPERALSHWRLWDHMDAILSLGIAEVTQQMIHPRPEDPDAISDEAIAKLNHLQKRDLLLLAAVYDHTLDMPARQRWGTLRRKLHYPTWRSEVERAIGFAVTLAVLIVTIGWFDLTDLFRWWVIGLAITGWLPWLWKQARLGLLAWQISRQVRVFDHLPNTLRRILSRFPTPELAGQPTPSKDRSDDRYELLVKFQAILKTLGFPAVVVLVDRVDEPHLVNGLTERMRDLLWPMFDNKFLKHPGIGFKLLLPAEVVYYLNREEKEFYERSRLDKQNLITSLEWTGESLYDVASDRIRACTAAGEPGVPVRALFDEAITEDELIGVFGRLRVPRHLFKFLYRLLVEHCNRYTDENPSWKISRDTMQTTLAVYMKDMEAFQRGMGTG